tara:strand:- start:42 stop:608 length:567 start_codon:yes stop_codon:yes gene_type:complete
MDNLKEKGVVGGIVGLLSIFVGLIGFYFVEIAQCKNIYKFKVPYECKTETTSNEVTIPFCSPFTIQLEMDSNGLPKQCDSVKDLVSPDQLEAYCGYFHEIDRLNFKFGKRCKYINGTCSGDSTQICDSQCQGTITDTCPLSIEAGCSEYYQQLSFSNEVSGRSCQIQGTSSCREGDQYNQCIILPKTP